MLVARRESGGEPAQRLNLFRSLVILIHLDDHFRRQSVWSRLRNHRTWRTTSFWSNRFRTRRIPKRIGRHSMLTFARYGTEFEACVPLTIHEAVLYIDMEVIHIHQADKYFRRQHSVRFWQRSLPDTRGNMAVRISGVCVFTYSVKRDPRGSFVHRYPRCRCDLHTCRAMRYR